MRNKITFTVIILFSIGLVASTTSPFWGFYAHKEINRLAVFTLPADMMPVFKKNIEFLTAQSIGPDMRRFASPNEGIRHYVDIDHWGDTPFEDVPHTWTEAILKFADYYVLTDTDTTLVRGVDHEALPQTLVFNNTDNINIDSLLPVFRRNFYRDLYGKRWELPIDSVLLGSSLDEFGITSEDLNSTNTKIRIVDRFSSFGISPYNISFVHGQLTRAFENHDLKRILRHAADIGHYIADAHVPLHTSENYNGQLTNQKGIHAFWETRLPELFAEDEYDYFVGRAEFIEDVSEYIWDVLEDTHSNLEEVLAIEKRLTETFPSDLQFCFEERNTRTVRTQCREFSRAYHDQMDGMVETQMRKAIQSIGSMWMSAWILAGEPDMKQIAYEYTLSEEEQEALQELRNQAREGKIKGRDHIN
jgi:hypothetical protein